MAQWEQASRVATIASAVGTVATVGVALWAAILAPGSLVRATRTGPGQAGGVAWPNTGVRMPGGPVAGRCKPSGPGAASVADDGEANSGASLGSGG